MLSHKLTFNDNYAFDEGTTTFLIIVRECVNDNILAFTVEWVLHLHIRSVLGSPQALLNFLLLLFRRFFEPQLR
jgi:hypothetical protein